MKEITALITAFFTSLFVRPTAISTQTTPTPPISPQAEMRIVNSELKFKVFEPRFNLSGISARLIYKYTGSLPKVKVAPIGNWIFPVQKVTPDTATNTVTVELAALDLSPNGFQTPAEEVTLANIEAGNYDAVVIDPNLTKIITKSGLELKL